MTLAAGTRLRQGAAFGLTADRLDFRWRRLIVGRQLTTGSGRAPEFGPPTTAARLRTVPLPTVVLDTLAVHLAIYGTGPDRLVLTNELGRPLRWSAFGTTWRNATKAAGTPGVTFHSLRHYYASLLIRHGESVKTVQDRMGHASGVETLDTHSHRWLDSDERTREAVDAVLRSAAESAPGAPADSLRTAEGAHRRFRRSDP